MQVSSTAMLLSSAFLVFSYLEVAAELSGREIMEKNFQITKLSRIHNEHTMILVNNKGQERVRKLTAVSLLQPNGVDSHLLIRFQFPGDVRGTGFLQLQHSAGTDELWVYLPGVKKVRRLVASNKRDSFFGSEFTYGDLLLPVVDTFHHTFQRREKLGNDLCLVVESSPANPSIASEYGYSKKVSWILASNFHERRIDYYDERGRPWKTQEASNFQQVQTEPARWWANRREMRNLQTSYKTIIVFDRVDTRRTVPKDLFTPQSLERG